jgi:hypothetical protein
VKRRFLFKCPRSSNLKASKFSDTILSDNLILSDKTIMISGKGKNYA